MAEFCKNIKLQLNQSRLIQDFINVNGSSLAEVCRAIETEDKYSEPMVVIGYYITVASIICLYAIMLDLSYDLRYNKFWFPSKYFSLNAASITIIAVAIKLPMDLSTPMPGVEDQVAKLGGLGFMCVMMCNFMPSLASMDNKSLFANVTGISILVITLIVNVAIQIKTQVIFNEHPFMTIACIYMGMLLFLLIILISSAITIPTSKKVLELKYQGIMNDQNPQENLLFTTSLENLKQHMRKYWIMAKTGSPQFVVASTPLSSASGIICAVSLVMHISLLWQLWPTRSSRKKTNPVYKQSTSQISMIQIVGVVMGSIAPISRCFTVLSFNSFANRNRKIFSVFKVENHWTQKVCEWKENPLSFFSIEMDHLHNLKNHILITCIGFQKVIVVSCKIIELIPVAVIIFVINCFKSLKAMLFTPPTASGSDHDTNDDLSNYVLLLEDDVPLTKYPVKRILASLNRLIEKAEKKQHNNLLKLLERSVSFEGVTTFDLDQIQSILPVESFNTWSLPIISLACIAFIIPNIDKDAVNNLLDSVHEGLFLTHVVEEGLNKASEYVNIQRATVTLWYEVKNKCKWLETTLKRSAYVGKTATEIIQLFTHKAEEVLNEFNTSSNGEPTEKEKFPSKVIAANSMYRITQAIVHTYESNNFEIIETELFTRLSNMIADILAACLTNIPRVVIMKCHESAIERREDSVMDAVNLLGRTSEIIKRLETRVPNMDQDKMAFIDEWRLHLRQP
ncbi:hypothetical protein HanHA300_Chr03g0080231 [Helianthus annuus]|nr:hypothetical protein HanHA300_Chr03g0080231 [Helianthus annuus]KAJ0767075.1 hypothetical protein HanLR1_Chr03g0084911 [Helianthus annuus]